MWKWLEENMDRIVGIAYLATAIIIVIGTSVAMYNLQAYYGKENICKEGRW